jgi:hypothetical protein
MICTAYKSVSLLIYATIAPSEKVFGTIGCNANHINATAHPRRAKQGCQTAQLILIQASSAARCSSMGAVPKFTPKEETWMNFYTRQHNQYCGIDLQAKAMDVCIRDQNGTKLVHKNLPTTSEAFLRVIAPYREELVVGVECMFTW